MVERLPGSIELLRVLNFPTGLRTSGDSFDVSTGCRNV